MPDNGGPSCLRGADLSLERVGRVRAFVWAPGGPEWLGPRSSLLGAPAGTFGRRSRGQKGTDPPEYPRLLRTTGRRFDPSSSPSASRSRKAK
jgi:hypothetical protein